MVTAVLNTEAGSNLVRQDVLPCLWLAKVPLVHSCKRAAGNTTFRVIGVIRLTVTVFTVALKQASQMILDTAFINMELLWIETSRQRMLPRWGHAVAIFKSFENEEAVQLATRAVMKHDGTIKKKQQYAELQTQRRFR